MTPTQRRCERAYNAVSPLVKKCWDIDPAATAMQIFGTAISAMGNLTDAQWKSVLSEILTLQDAAPPEMTRHQLNALRAMRATHREMAAYLKSLGEETTKTPVP